MLFILYPAILVVISLSNNNVFALKHYTKERKLELREQVRSMFQHAYEGYLLYASDYDELRPLTCDGVDTWGSYSLTMIDALDTLATMGNFTEFRRVVKLLEQKMDFDKDINVSVFETNIRIVGGLLSAHLLSKKANVELEEGWPCQGPLLRMAEDVAKRLLPAFDTATGMPYGTVNLRYGVPKGETSITCTAGVGTLLVEFGTLSRLTGNPIYEDVALNAIHALWQRRSPIGLFGNHIDVQSGRWTALDSGIGAGVDSLFEYMVKAAILLQRPELLEMFHSARSSIDKYLRHDDWYVWAGMNKGQVTLPVFQSLEAFWPGVLSLIGDKQAAIRTLANYASVWRKYGFLPEFYNIPTGEASANRESYPLRPELVESAMYLYRATRNEFLLELGESMLKTIEYSAKTRCGYATIRNVVTHEKENRMESFFLAETTKYLYLLFDDDNFLHNDAAKGNIIKTSDGGECVIDAGPYIFNTEAHPIDMSALHCCHDHKFNLFEGLDLSQYSDATLLKQERELIILQQNEAFEECKTKHPVSSKETGKRVVPPAKAAATPSLAVDIEVFDDDNKPAGDILVENFERVKNDIVPMMKEMKKSRDNRNQLTVTDLQEFFAQTRENFKSPLQVKEYTVGFLKNFTLEPNFIAGLQIFERNISNLLGSATQKEFESSTKTLWNLFCLQQEYRVNVKFLIALNLHSFDENNKQMLHKTLLVLNGDESDPSNDFIWQKINELHQEYSLALVNITEMQTFLLNILINGTNEKQKSFKPLLDDNEILTLPLEAHNKPQQLKLFAQAKRVVEFKKRMIDTFDKLQTLMVESGKQQEKLQTDNKNSAQNDDLIVPKPSNNNNNNNNNTTPSYTANKESFNHTVANLTAEPQLNSSLQTNENNNSYDSVWSQLVHTILRKTTTQKLEFDVNDLLQKTRKSLQKLTADIPVHYNVLTCPRPKFIERFAYRYYYP
ncbi:ER degradation-enhancing alpha-mannosidase-like protein 2 [Cochliomyia hominivorax]